VAAARRLHTPVGCVTELTHASQTTTSCSGRAGPVSHLKPGVARLENDWPGDASARSRSAVRAVRPGFDLDRWSRWDEMDCARARCRPLLANVPPGSTSPWNDALIGFAHARGTPGPGADPVTVGPRGDQVTTFRRHTMSKDVITEGSTATCRPENGVRLLVDQLWPRHPQARRSRRHVDARRGAVHRTPRMPTRDPATGRPPR
jgi:hypothetical protein